MLIPVLLFIVGLLCLIKGGDWFVDGATGIARRFHVPELLIGATVVSIGTTLPEVMVSTTSALTGHGEIAYGNAIGSVICNSALIAAITIAVRPGKVDPKSLRTPVAFFFVAAAFYAGVAYTTGSFTRPVGLILLAMFVAYIVCNVLAMKNTPAPEEEEQAEEGPFAKELGLLVIGAVLIAVGADLLVDNGTLIAQALGVPAPVKRSLAFLLLSISLWFIGYNGVTTWFTKYVEAVMGEGLGGASTCLLVATAGAIVSYIPIGALAAKIGRKRTIQCGIVLLATCFMLGYLLTTMYTSIQPIMYVVFALVGLAWAAINVNSLPMVVEMCRGSDIGKFTGYYYTFSMAAQVVTPIVAGSLMRAIDYRVLFPYAALFVALSFVTMCFVNHGDARAEAKKGLAAFEDMDS